MKTYHVQWSIEIEAESPREAAEKSREIQLDPESVATVFDVHCFDAYKSEFGEIKYNHKQVEIDLQEEGIEEQ